jgi:hypothetical protein
MLLRQGSRHTVTLGGGASIACKWLLAETDADHADALLASGCA